MCTIIVCMSGTPTIEELEEADKANGDGAGIAWPGKDKDGNPVVHYRRGLSSVKEIQEVYKKEKLKGVFPFIIHFRAASSGGKDARLTHPFPLDKVASLELSGTAPGVLAHNGTWSGWRTDLREMARAAKGSLRIPRGPWSDSRAMAFLTANFGPGYMETVDASYGKFVTLEANGDVYTTGTDSWEFADLKKRGFFASNDRYMVKPAKGITVVHDRKSVCSPPPPPPALIGPGKSQTVPKVDEDWDADKVKQVVEDMNRCLPVSGVAISH